MSVTMNSSHFLWSAFISWSWKFLKILLKNFQGFIKTLPVIFELRFPDRWGQYSKAIVCVFVVVLNKTIIITTKQQQQKKKVPDLEMKWKMCSNICHDIRLSVRQSACFESDLKGWFSKARNSAFKTLFKNIPHLMVTILDCMLLCSWVRFQPSTSYFLLANFIFFESDQQKRLSPFVCITFYFILFFSIKVIYKREAENKFQNSGNFIFPHKVVGT